MVFEERGIAEIVERGGPIGHGDRAVYEKIRSDLPVLRGPHGAHHSKERLADKAHMKGLVGAPSPAIQ